MNAIEVSHLTYRYGKVAALRDLDLAIPEGAIYALLGPNGSGKTTLLQILMGLRRAQQGRAALLGVESGALTARDRSTIGYVAEGQALPGWMRIEQLEAYLAPLYPTWDRALAGHLRERFGLDPRKKVKALSRGDAMKAALLCALAPRPKLLIMDEPFTGMDVLVKDDLVRGLLDYAGSEGWTVMISSHDLGELEPLADWVGFLDEGRLQLSEPMETLSRRFKRIEVVLDESRSPLASAMPAEWLSVERSGHLVSFLVDDFSDALVNEVLPARFPGAARVEVLEASLRDVFVGLARRSRPSHQQTVAA